MKRLLLSSAFFIAALVNCTSAHAQPAAPSASRALDTIVTYDLTHVWGMDLNDPKQLRRHWDECHLVTSLQGLVNRDAPRLFVRTLADPDDFWWQQMTAPGAWLDGRKVERVASLEELLSRFRSFYKGVVAWDERVPATSNLASTIAGCDGLLCLRYDESPDSLYSKLTRASAPLAIGVRLLAEDGQSLFTGKGTIPGTTIASTGSAKCDAYRWLVERFV
jgi:hypothetical protein